jgi:lipopolysaccharide biosynthesis protein
MYLNGTHLQKGNQYFRDKDYDNAITEYLYAIKELPELSGAIDFNIGLAKKRKGANLVETEIQKFIGNAVADLNYQGDPRIKLAKPPQLEQYYFEKIVESNLFDPIFYLENYANLLYGVDNLLDHYLTEGQVLKLNPSLHFDTAYYERVNPDIMQAEVLPFIHFVCNGIYEGREAVPQPYNSKYEVAPIEYIPRLHSNQKVENKSVRAICFYLPQFHAIPENDEWWGKGFTEWTNVKPATPQFEGHYQPHVPHDDIGYYNLLERDAQAKQIELAKQYGIEGFCYYLYWFSGQRLLEQPLDNMLADPTLDFPFCVCWANENWSRRWDGKDQDLLMVQNYSDEDDLAFIENVSKYLKDPRYIRIDGKPLLLVYRPNLFPDMKATTKRWRDWCLYNGVGEIYLVYPQSFETVSPLDYDFDAACEFPPNNSKPPKIIDQVDNLNVDFEGMVYDWRVFPERSDNYDKKPYKFFRSATPSWDNTARKKNKGMIFHNSCPTLFTKNLVNVFSETIRTNDNTEERMTFINAWNEWAEGAHLEPDQRYGYAWLQSVKDAHDQINRAMEKKIAIVIHAFYPEILEEVLSDINWAKEASAKIYITTPHETLAIMKEVASRYDYSISINAFSNHGRDVLPFLKVLPKIIADENEFLIKVHTKKSLHREDGDKWRQELYGQLLSLGMFVRAVNMFEKDNALAMISPDGNLVPISYYWGSNEVNVLKLCKQYGINFDKNANYQFIAGTMFFAKVEMFKKLVEALSISDDMFDKEEGQVDGTLAHAYERFFGVYAKEIGANLRDFQLKDKEFVYAKKS